MKKNVPRWTSLRRMFQGKDGIEFVLFGMPECRLILGKTKLHCNYCLIPCLRRNSCLPLTPFSFHVAVIVHGMARPQDSRRGSNKNYFDIFMTMNQIKIKIGKLSSSQQFHEMPVQVVEE